MEEADGARRYAFLARKQKKKSKIAVHDESRSIPYFVYEEVTENEKTDDVSVTRPRPLVGKEAGCCVQDVLQSTALARSGTRVALVGAFHTIFSTALFFFFSYFSFSSSFTTFRRG